LVTDLPPQKKTPVHRTISERTQDYFLWWQGASIDNAVKLHHPWMDLCLLAYQQSAKGRSRTLPQNGEISKVFGVFRNLCCGAEIIIRAGATFPDCEKHPTLTTVWIEMKNENQNVIVAKNKSRPAA